MELERPLMRMDSVATGIYQQCALHALCIPGIVSRLNSTLGSIVANDITVPKGQTLYSHGDVASNLYIVKNSGFKIMTPPSVHDAHLSGISNAR